MTTGDPTTGGTTAGGSTAGGSTGTGTTGTLVEVRYFAAAAEAAGRDAEHVPVAPGTSVGALLDALAQRHGPALGTVAARCALLVDGALHRDRDELLGSPRRVDVLPPFAGG